MKASKRKVTQHGEYVLDFYDGFEEKQLNLDRWFPYYLPQWSSRESSMPSYKIEQDKLILTIAETQKEWASKLNPNIRVSSLQTGVFSGEVGSGFGQHRFSKECIVSEKQPLRRLYTPKYGYIEFRARCNISENNVVAFWMIGFEEKPEESAEICIFELKGNHIQKEGAIIGYGIHPFSDKRIKDQFYEDFFPINVSEYNKFAVEWEKSHIRFYLNEVLIRTIDQSPDYSMQLMLNIYDLQNKHSENQDFYIDYVAGYKYQA